LGKKQQTRTRVASENFIYQCDHVMRGARAITDTPLSQDRKLLILNIGLAQRSQIAAYAERAAAIQKKLRWLRAGGGIG